MFPKVTAMTGLMPFCWVPGDPDPVLFDPWWPASGPSAPTAPDAPLLPATVAPLLPATVAPHPRGSSKGKRPRNRTADVHANEEQKRRKTIDDSFGTLSMELPVAINTPRIEVLQAAKEEIDLLETMGDAILAQRDLLIAYVNAQLAALGLPLLVPIPQKSFVPQG